MLAAHGPGLARMSFVKMSGSRARVKVACRTRTAIGAGGFRTERKEIIYTSMFKRVLPFRNFQYIILTSVCDHGYVSDWASAMKSLLSEKIFWGGEPETSET